MANTIKFDREQALNSAMRLFWRKGYHATSTRDLQQATSLKPGSLYGSFQSKQMLLIETLNHYMGALRKQLDLACQKHTNPMVALQEFSIQTLFHFEQASSNLCFLYKTQVELGDTEHKDLTKPLMQEVESWFLELFIQAQQQGILYETEKPEILVKSFQLQILGWRTYLASTGDVEFVRDAVDTFFARWTDDKLKD